MAVKFESAVRAGNVFMLRLVSIIAGIIISIAGFMGGSGCNLLNGTNSSSGSNTNIAEPLYGAVYYPTIEIQGTISNTNKKAVPNIEVSVTNNIYTNASFSISNGSYQLSFEAASYYSNITIVYHDTNTNYFDITDTILLSGFTNSSTNWFGNPYVTNINVVMTNT